MQVKWHLWTYPTASLVVFLDMTHCMQVQRYSLVSYCQSNPSSHQEGLVTMVMDYNTGPHACQRECWWIRWGDTNFPQSKTSMCSWRKHLPPPYTRGRRPLCRSPSWGRCCPHLCCSPLWLSWCWVLPGGWSQSERECCISRTRWLRLISFER